MISCHVKDARPASPTGIVGHPVRSVPIEFGGGVDEAPRTAAPIDESLNEADRKQSERSDAQCIRLAALGDWIGGCHRAVERKDGHDDFSYVA
jgi:hypothetical protein